jgi:cardiolipin synthase (CMP-forming)
VKRSLKHLPNALTGLRLAAAPATAALLLFDHYWPALVVFAFAGLSDLLDGFLAKRYGVTSRFGRYLDPAADKALMFACFLVLAFQHIVPVWLAATVIGRDLLMVLAIAVAKLSDTPLSITPLRIGKLTTLVQVIFIGVQLFALTLNLDLADFLRWAGLVVAMVTAASAVVYFIVWLRAMRRTKGRARAEGT